MSRKLIKYVVAIIACFYSISVSASEIELPEAVKKTFVKMFPNAKDVRWEGNSDSYYEIGFNNGGKDNTAIILPDGSLKEIDILIGIEELPLRVVKAVQKKFPKSKITFAVKINRGDETTVYDLEINTGLELIDITLSPLGYEVN